MFLFFQILSRPTPSLPPLKMVATLVDWSQTSFWISVAAIAFNPTAWNIVAQNGEQNKLIMSKQALTNCRIPQQDLDAYLWWPEGGLLLPGVDDILLRNSS